MTTSLSMKLGNALEFNIGVWQPFSISDCSSLIFGKRQFVTPAN
ncbi:hypothetical protein VIBNISO65_1460048 [Vibrio nigripulchritudo SO65]|nr:hypothetical protein VIBNIFTn2_280048 [Vibrio nigripulchritudo FTn2]CCN65905.1 hypothetical protein VIBNIPon4_470048 [Vibrio nigripulchritudo POn4]CCN75913.1 hypothetical protein VIBNISO65_1460048 [Vibrio nigripulchritudo SO65]